MKFQAYLQHLRLQDISSASHSKLAIPILSCRSQITLKWECGTRFLLSWQMAAPAQLPLGMQLLLMCLRLHQHSLRGCDGLHKLCLLHRTMHFVLPRIDQKANSASAGAHGMVSRQCEMADAKKIMAGLPT